jgi:ATPase subunit of ABC transporter with duplicated ATPase domains
LQRNKASVATRNMAMSRQKKLDKMEVIEIAKEKPKPQFNFKEGRTAGKLIFEATDLVIGYDSPLSRPLNLRMERGQKIALVGANGIGKTTLLRSILGEIQALSGSVHKGENQQSAISNRKLRNPTTIRVLKKCGTSSRH